MESNSGTKMFQASSPNKNHRSRLWQPLIILTVSLIYLGCSSSNSDSNPNSGTVSSDSNSLSGGQADQFVAVKKLIYRDMRCFIQRL